MLFRSIDGNRIVLSINGRRFSQADREMKAAMIIRLAYKVVQRGEKLVLERDGQVTVDYENPADESARTLAFKTFLTDKLNSADAKDEGVELPGNLLPTDRVEELKNSELAKELQFFERVKARLRNRDTYQEFLKCLHLFNQDVISKMELRGLVYDVLGRVFFLNARLRY